MNNQRLSVLGDTLKEFLSFPWTVYVMFLWSIPAAMLLEFARFSHSS